jgi:rubredoxin
MKYQCPCCGFHTLPEKPPGTDDICKVCFWEDDYSQFYNPKLGGGANKESLEKARENYKEFGVSDRNFADKVRKPLNAERIR